MRLTSRRLPFVFQGRLGLAKAALLCGLGLGFWGALAPALANDEIEITADKSLEWYQDTRLYVARGGAKAVKGDTTITADILSAHERDPDAPVPPGAKAGRMDRLTAEGNVHLIDPKQQVFGERAVYDLDLKKVKMTGRNLKYMTDKDIVTARDSLEYDETLSVATARGAAKGHHEDRHVEGDVLTAHFVQTPNGQTEMTQMTAEGNVTVVSGDGISKGDKAVYNVKDDKALMTGHVRITQGQTQLAGDRAEVDFTTNQSRLLNDGSGRVRALLAPSNDDKKSGSKSGSASKAAKKNNAGDP